MLNAKVVSTEFVCSSKKVFTTMLCLASTMLPLTAVAQTTNSGAIVYTSNANVSGGNPTGDHEIWIMKGDGTYKTQLTFNTVDDHAPNISLDGTKITFIRDVINVASQAVNQLWTMNSDGTNQNSIAITNVLPTLDILDNPRWDPSGQKIAFQGRDFYTLTFATYTYTLPNLGALGAPFRYYYENAQPAWSPDGRRLVFIRKATNSATDVGGTTYYYTQSLYLTDPDFLTIQGPEIKQLSYVVSTPFMRRNDPIQLWQPVFNRTGDKIFYYDKSNGLRSVNLDGSGLTRINRIAFHPDFSPDGTKIVATSIGFTKGSNLNGYGSIFTMNADGSGVTTLATGVEPSWGRAQ